MTELDPKGKNSVCKVAYRGARAVLLLQELFPEMPEDMLLADVVAILAEKMICSRATAYRYASAAIWALHGIPYRVTLTRRKEIERRRIAAYRNNLKRFS